jgi:hypothetical protein
MFGANETPPNASTAIGSSTVILDTTAQTLAVSVLFTGLIGGSAAAAHIHCCAPPGVAEIVAVPFPGFPMMTSISVPYTNTFDLTQSATYNAPFVTAHGGTVASAEAALIAGMNAGMTYTNIHNATFPGGEIRGQLAAVPEPTTLALGVSGLLLLAALRRR